MHESLDFYGFLLRLLQAPSPWIGGIMGAILGGFITGGAFGWLTHIRNIRPTLVFFRDETEASPKWKMRNIGQGAAMYIRVRDYKGGSVVRKVKPYALRPGDDRPLDWVTGGDRLEADYTDVYGRRWYQSVGDDNNTVFKRRHRSLWRRPSKKDLEDYEPEIHVLRGSRSRDEVIKREIERALPKPSENAEENSKKERKR